MRKKLPPSIKYASIVLVTIALLIGTGFAANGFAPTMFSGIASDMSGALSAWWTSPAAVGASVSTDKADYTPGEVAQISGSGFGANDVVTLKVTDIGSNTESYDASGYANWTVNAGSDGHFSTSWLVGAEAANRKLLLTASGSSGASASTTFTDAVGISNYSQCSNDDGDGYASGDTGCRWINGNLNANNSTYQEGDATPQRLWLEGLVPGSTGHEEVPALN